MINLLIEKKVEVVDDNESKEEESENKKTYKTCFSLLKLVKHRLQHILKTLIKICLTKPAPNKDCGKLTKLYKTCYVKSFELKDDLDYNSLLEQLGKVLKAIRDETESFNNNL